MQSETVAGGFLTAAIGIGAVVLGAAIALTGSHRRPDFIGWVGMLLTGIGLSLTGIGFHVAGGGV